MFFLPSPIRPHALERALGEACPKLEIQVKGRKSDYFRQVQKDPPDAILSLPPVTDQSKGFRPILFGAKNGKKTEPYLLLSIDKSVELEQLGDMTIGVVDLFARRQMTAFLKEKLKIPKPRFKTVTKTEDLLSLLQFKDVDVVFIPEARVSYYTEKTRMTLVQTPLDDVRVGILALAVRTEDPETIKILIESLEGLSDNIKNKLGVETWQRP